MTRAAWLVMVGLLEIVACFRGMDWVCTQLSYSDYTAARPVFSKSLHFFRIMPRKTTFAEIMRNLPPKVEQPDVLGEMGPGVRRVPFQLWKDRFLFRGALNTALREKTGVFPARLGKTGETHPVFLLRKIANFGFQACPCTSKKQFRTRYIRRDCTLRITNRTMDRDSYILERLTFNLTMDDAFRRDLVFQGQAPEECIGG